LLSNSFIGGYAAINYTLDIRSL